MYYKVRVNANQKQKYQKIDAVEYAFFIWDYDIKYMHNDRFRQDPT